jgi:putative FmdB family regulatory protein
MPIYEFECRGCRQQFEQLIMHSSTKPECPSCHGRDLERLVSSFGVDSDATRGSALQDAKRRQAQTTRDHNDAEISYHRKHDDH